MVSCSASIIKILLGIFNLLWLILGGGVVYIGVRLVLWEKDFSEAVKLADLSLKSASFAILAVGVVIALISFLGFFGACCENSFMLNAYGFLMILMIGAQVYAIVYAAHNHNNIEDNISEGVINAINHIHNNTDTAVTLDWLQVGLQCCGWKNGTDYKETMPVNKVPASCCGVKPEGNKPTGTCTINSEGYFKVGCAERLHFDQIETLFKGTIGVGVAVILFELILVFAACCLAREVR